MEKIFRSLKEDEIISTIQALKYSEQVGWRIWSPLVYNVILNYNRFFNALISLDSLFRDEISAEVFLGRSTKMQMYYARILNRPDTKEIIMDKIDRILESKLKERGFIPGDRVRTPVPKDKFKKDGIKFGAEVSTVNRINKSGSVRVVLIDGSTKTFKAKDLLLVPNDAGNVEIGKITKANKAAKTKRRLT